MTLPALRIDEPTVDLAALFAHASRKLRPHRRTATFRAESSMRFGIYDQLFAEREQSRAQGTFDTMSAAVIPIASFNTSISVPAIPESFPMSSGSRPKRHQCFANAAPS